MVQGSGQGTQIYLCTKSALSLVNQPWLLDINASLRKTATTGKNCSLPLQKHPWNLLFPLPHARNPTRIQYPPEIHYDTSRAHPFEPCLRLPEFIQCFPFIQSFAVCVATSPQNTQHGNCAPVIALVYWDDTDQESFQLLNKVDRIFGGAEAMQDSVSFVVCQVWVCVTVEQRVEKSDGRLFDSIVQGCLSSRIHEIKKHHSRVPFFNR